MTSGRGDEVGVTWSCWDGSGDVAEGVPDVFGFHDLEAGGEGHRADGDEGAFFAGFAAGALFEGAGGDESAGEAHPGGLVQAAADVADRAQFAGQAYFAEDDQARWEGFVACRAGDGEHDGEVDGGVDEFDAADGGGEDVAAAESGVEPALQDGEDHLDPEAVEPRGGAARLLGLGPGDQRLYFGRQRPGSLKGDRDTGAGDGFAPPGDEEAARVGDALNAAFVQVEAADLVGRAVPVLDRADHAQPGVPVALEAEHHVDEVLQGARTRDRALLGDMADQHGRHVPLLGQPDQVGGHLADLGHPTGHTGRLRRTDRLYGVDDQQLRIDLLHMCDKRAQIGLGREIEVVPDRPDTVGT